MNYPLGHVLKRSCKRKQPVNQASTGTKARRQNAEIAITEDQGPTGQSSGNGIYIVPEKYADAVALKIAEQISDNGIYIVPP